MLFVVWSSEALQEHDSWENRDVNALFIDIKARDREEKRSVISVPVKRFLKYFLFCVQMRFSAGMDRVRAPQTSTGIAP